MTMPRFPSQEAFEAYAEQQAEAFRARYGLGPEDAWTDAQIEQALADHDMPPMMAIPDRAEGMMAGLGRPGDVPGAWRRTNALHLIAHAMVHNGGRCEGCVDWGTD